MKELFLLTLVLILELIACSKKIKPVETEKEIPTLSPEEKIDLLAKETFQKEYQIIYNESKSVVCISKAIKRRPNDIFPSLSFLLYNPDTETVLFKETIAKATGKWISDQQFEVTTVTGRVGRAASLNKKQGFVYDIQKVTKSKL